MDVSDFDYSLPIELIAQFPLAKRSASRLMVINKNNGNYSHHTFTELPNFLQANDLLIFNNTKVIPARLFAHKPTGGKVEVLVERVLSNNKLLAQTKASKSLKIGNRLIIAIGVEFEVAGREGDFFLLELHAAAPLTEVLAQFGQIPLPPYITHTPTPNDQERYQTIYAKYPGAVAAPTAGLHFDENIMLQLQEKNIATTFLTLHVGAGTFQPIRVKTITEHKMHAEYIEVSQSVCEQIATTKKQGGRVFAVGTTTARALETAAQSGELQPYTGETEIFIYPGYKFRCIDGLITNFHLPKSTLLMLVSAFGGYENIMRAYQEAVAQKYRFFSYGDAMLIM